MYIILSTPIAYHLFLTSAVVSSYCSSSGS